MNLIPIELYEVSDDEIIMELDRQVKIQAKIISKLKKQRDIQLSVITDYKNQIDGAKATIECLQDVIGRHDLILQEKDAHIKKTTSKYNVVVNLEKVSQNRGLTPKTVIKQSKINGK